MTVMVSEGVLLCRGGVVKRVPPPWDGSEGVKGVDEDFGVVDDPPLPLPLSGSDTTIRPSTCDDPG